MKSNNFFFCLLAIVLFSFTSCDKLESTNDVQEFADIVEEDVATQTRSGSGQCFEVQYPIELTLPDATIIEVESREHMRESIIAWRTDNPDVRGRAKVNFPIDVITSDGELVTVESPQELRQLRRSCIDRPVGDRRPCFRLVYPVGVVDPNGNVVKYDNRKDMRGALRRWKNANPTASTRPMLSFPINVVTKDGQQVTFQSREEMAAFKEDCK